MRNHFVCGNSDPSIGGVYFKYGHKTTVFGYSNAPQSHGLHMARHEYVHHWHRHGPHNHGSSSKKKHGHGPHNHGPHINKWHYHGTHGHESHTYQYSFHRPCSFGPNQGNQTFPPHHFWKNNNHPKGVLCGGPHQYRRGHREDGKQVCNKGDYANLNNIKPRPRSV